MKEYDERVFKELDGVAEDLIKKDYKSKQLMRDMAKVYRGEWAEGEKLEKTKSNIKVTVNPDARNAIVGARRLMTATEEAWKIPDSQRSGKAVDNASLMEKFARLTWRAASGERRQPLRVDIATSLLIFSKVHIGVVKTNDMVVRAAERVEQESDPAKRRYLEIALQRAMKLQQKTEFIYHVWNPIQGSSNYDEYGLNYFVREYQTTWGDIANRYGRSAIEEHDGAYKKLTDPVTVRDCWDLVWHQEYIKGAQTPLMQALHGLDFIPVVEKDGEGNTIFEAEDERLEPFLYTVLKTGWYDRLNLASTIMATNAFAYAGTPPLVYKEPPGGGDLIFKFRNNPPLIMVPNGGDLSPLNWTENSKAIQDLLVLGQNAVTESTMFKQTMGAPLGNSATYSYVALLNQSGRLPLTPYLKQANSAISEAMKMAMLWMRKDEGTYKASYGDDRVIIASQDVPEEFDLICSLDVALPQDKLGTSQIALNLNQLGKLPWSWIATELLDIEDWEASQVQWSKEQLYGAMVAEKIRDLAQKRELLRRKELLEWEQQNNPAPNSGNDEKLLPPGANPNAPPPVNFGGGGYGTGLGDAPNMPDGIPGTIEAGASPVPPQPIEPTDEPLGFGL